MRQISMLGKQPWRKSYLIKLGLVDFVQILETSNDDLVWPSPNDGRIILSTVNQQESTSERPPLLSDRPFLVDFESQGSGLHRINAKETNNH